LKPNHAFLPVVCGSPSVGWSAREHRAPAVRGDDERGPHVFVASRTPGGADRHAGHPAVLDDRPGGQGLLPHDDPARSGVGEERRVERRARQAQGRSAGARQIRKRSLDRSPFSVGEQAGVHRHGALSDQRRP
jgi:hypothetical protein